jgi:hypothetical protein
MAKNRNEKQGDNQTDKSVNRNQSSGNMDLTDSKRDQERLQPDEATIDLPDVKDIPGQEHVHVPPLGEIADTTISSDDEEGIGVFEDDIEDETIITMGEEADINKSDKEMLETAEDYMPTEDEDRLRRAALDQTDDEGELLNERGLAKDRTGEDLDVPGASQDDRNENIGEEDEENNPYSLGSDSNDNVTEGTP